MQTVVFFLLYITFKNYQMEKNMIKNHWFIQRISIKCIIFIANCLTLKIAQVN